MGRISRRHLHSALEERIHEVFCEHLARLTSPASVKEFLQSLLSYTERVMLAKRIAIAILLSRGHTYESIDRTLKVSKATVATVHRQLLTGAPGYARVIEQARRAGAKEQFWDTLEEVFLKLSLPAREGSVKHQLKSEIGKNVRKRKFQREVIG